MCIFHVIDSNRKNFELTLLSDSQQGQQQGLHWLSLQAEYRATSYTYAPAHSKASHSATTPPPRSHHLQLS